MNFTALVVTPMKMARIVFAFVYIPVLQYGIGTYLHNYYHVILTQNECKLDNIPSLSLNKDCLVNGGKPQKIPIFCSVLYHILDDIF